jgi:hypothetical protein
VDPFSLVYDKLWDLAEASVPLTRLVKLKNRIKFSPTKVYDPVKREVSEADLPELTLTSTTGSANMMANSSMSSCTRTYEWIIATGSLSIIAMLGPVEFALWCALHDYQSYLNALQWDGKDFVKVARVGQISNGLTDSERNRGIVGWTSIWSLDVEMYFVTKDLKDFNTGV